jgi:hypothetical protein
MRHKWDGINPRSKSCWVGGFRVSSSLLSTPNAVPLGQEYRHLAWTRRHVVMASGFGKRAGLPGWAGLVCGLLLLLLRLSPLHACCPLGAVVRSLSSCASGTALPSLMVTRSRNVQVLWWVSTSLCHLVSLLLTPFALRAWKIRHWGGRGAGKEGRFARTKDSSENKKKKGATRIFFKNRTETWKRV